MKLIRKGLILLVAGCVLAIISILSVAATTDDRTRFAKLIEPGETAIIDELMDTLQPSNTALAINVVLDKSTSRN